MKNRLSHGVWSVNALRQARQVVLNDANLWATEKMNNPKYPLELVLLVITVSLETMKIVDSLPKLDFNTLS